MSVRAIVGVFVVSFLAGGCASTLRAPVGPSGGPREAVGVTQPVESGSEGARLVRVATGLIGAPYRYGGESPRGFDCSGLVFYSFDRVGVKVPRTAAEQRRVAQRVKRDALVPGDLVFFRTSARRVDHVGIYTGDGRFIHAPRRGHPVSYGYLDDPYYRSHFVSAGRFL
jgi:cell wall-associated NlpC family hydrolase